MPADHFHGHLMLALESLGVSVGEMTTFDAPANPDAWRDDPRIAALVAAQQGGG